MTRFELTRDLDALNVCDLEDFAVDGWVHGALSCPCARAAGLREALLAVDCGALEALLDEAGEGALLSAPVFEGRTACWFAAAAAGDETLVRFLAERDADVNAPAAGPSLLFTPLHAAVLRGHLDIVQALSDHGASLDPLDARGRTPLWLAARCGDADMCVLLCGLGADADEGDHVCNLTVLGMQAGGTPDAIGHNR